MQSPSLSSFPSLLVIAGKHISDPHHTVSKLFTAATPGVAHTRRNWVVFTLSIGALLSLLVTFPLPSFLLFPVHQICFSFTFFPSFVHFFSFLHDAHSHSVGHFRFPPLLLATQRFERVGLPRTTFPPLQLRGTQGLHGDPSVSKTTAPSGGLAALAGGGGGGGGGRGGRGATFAFQRGRRTMLFEPFVGVGFLILGGRGTGKGGDCRHCDGGCGRNGF
jgi:hypothetical protein